MMVCWGLETNFGYAIQNEKSGTFLNEVNKFTKQCLLVNKFTWDLQLIKRESLFPFFHCFPSSLHFQPPLSPTQFSCWPFEDLWHFLGETLPEVALRLATITVKHCLWMIRRSAHLVSVVVWLLHGCPFLIRVLFWHSIVDVSILSESIESGLNLYGEISYVSKKKQIDGNEHFSITSLQFLLNLWNCFLKIIESFLII